MKSDFSGAGGVPREVTVVTRNNEAKQMEYQMIHLTIRGIICTIAGAMLGAVTGALYAFAEAGRNLK